MLSRSLVRSARRLAQFSPQTTLQLRPLLRLAQHSSPNPRFASHSSPASSTPIRFSHATSNKSPADEAIDEITELYATAQDEFEIAMEETEKQTVYAQDDRDAAREEFEKMKEAFTRVVEGEDREVAEEVRNRVGQRVRELEAGILRMEEMAQEHD